MPERFDMKKLVIVFFISRVKISWFKVAVNLRFEFDMNV